MYELKKSINRVKLAQVYPKHINFKPCTGLHSWWWPFYKWNFTQASIRKIQDSQIQVVFGRTAFHKPWFYPSITFCKLNPQWDIKLFYVLFVFSFFSALYMNSSVLDNKFLQHTCIWVTNKPTNQVSIVVGGNLTYHTPLWYLLFSISICYQCLTGRWSLLRPSESCCLT